MPNRYDGDTGTRRDLEAGFNPPRNQRSLLLTSNEIGRDADGGVWHLLDEHANPYCEAPSAGIGERYWLADRQRGTVRLCPECRVAEPEWSTARRKEYYGG